MAVFHPEPLRDSAQLLKAQLFIKMPCGGIALHHSIELQYAKAKLPCFINTVSY